MAQAGRGSKKSPHAVNLQRIFQSVRKLNRPKLLGESPCPDAERKAYIFTQTIRSDADRSGIAYHDLKYFVVTFYGAPEVPKPKSMNEILDSAKSFIKHSSATSEAAECILFADENGRIVLAKSKSYPHGFNFRFLATGN